MARTRKANDAPGCGFYLLFVIVMIAQAFSDKSEEPRREADGRQVEPSIALVKYHSDEELVGLHRNGRLSGVIDPQKNRTALHVAAMLNRPQVLRMLIDSKENVSARDKNQVTPLHLALESQASESEIGRAHV